MEGETIQWPKDTASYYSFVIFWSLYCLSFHFQLLITPLLSFGHCIVSLSIYSFWLQLWYLLVIVLSLFPFTASDYTFGIFWSLYCLSFHLQLLITPLEGEIRNCKWKQGQYNDQKILKLYSEAVNGRRDNTMTKCWFHLWYLLVIVLSLLPFTASDYTFGIFWSLYCLSFHLQLLITALVSFGHCIASPSIYSFWLHLWYLLVIVLSLLPFTASDYPLVSFGHCIVSPSIYSFWLQLWYLLVIVLSLLPFTSCKWKERQYNDQKIPKM
jgi:hypothetical protein